MKLQTTRLKLPRKQVLSTTTDLVSDIVWTANAVTLWVMRVVMDISRVRAAADSRAFQLQYAHRTASMDLWSSTMALLTTLGIAIKAALRLQDQPTALQDDCFWVRTAAVITTLVLYWRLGKEQYILTIGPNSVWQRMLFAAGLIFGARPGDCHTCGWLWRHRLLFVHVALAARRTPATWYWVGGVISIFTAAMVDVADPAASSRKVVQLAVVLQAAISRAPWQFLQQALQVIASNSSIYLADLVLPGVLMTWLEWRSYKAWSKQVRERQQQQPLQQQQQQPLGASGVSRPHHHHQGSSSSSSGSASSSGSIASYDSDSTDYAIYATSDLTVGPLALCFGFPDPTAEAAYHTYKSVSLRGLDLFSSVVFAFLAVACNAKLLLTLCSNNQEMTLVAMVRAFYLTLFACVHTLVWMASCNTHLAGLQQWRSAILYGGVVFGQAATVISAMTGGALAAASSAAVAEYFASPLILLAFRHLVQPNLLLANITPATVLYLQFQFLVFDAKFGRPQVLGLGPGATAWLCVFVHLAVAFQLEARLRRQFVRSHFAASTA